MNSTGCNAAAVPVQSTQRQWPPAFEQASRERFASRVLVAFVHPNAGGYMMKRVFIVSLTLVMVALPMLVDAAPVTGTYYSAFRGGNVMLGRASVSRQFVNS